MGDVHSPCGAPLRGEKHPRMGGVFSHALCFYIKKQVFKSKIFAKVQRGYIMSFRDL